MSDIAHVVKAIVLHAIAVIVHVGIKTHIEETRRTIGHVERSTVTPRSTHVIRYRIADDTVEIVIVFGIGQSADFIGAPAAVGLQTDVAETLEELLPACFHVVGITVFKSGRIARRITIVAIPAEGADLVFTRVRHAHRVVEFPVVHTLRTVSQVDGRTHIEEIQRAVVSKRHLAEISVSDAVAAHAHTCADRESAPAVGPVDIGIQSCFRAIKTIGAQYVDTVIMDAAIVGIKTVIVAVVLLIVGTQTVTEFAIIAVRTVVTRIKIEAKTHLATQQIAIFVQIGINIV